MPRRTIRYSVESFVLTVQPVLPEPAIYSILTISQSTSRVAPWSRSLMVASRRNVFAGRTETVTGDLIAGTMTELRKRRLFDSLAGNRCFLLLIHRAILPRRLHS